MAEKRAFTRYYLTELLKARYQLEGKEVVFKECTIFNISPNGFGIRFDNNTTMDTGSIINLEIEVKKDLTPLRIKGTVKWLKTKDEGMGGELSCTMY